MSRATPKMQAIARRLIACEMPADPAGNSSGNLSGNPAGNPAGHPAGNRPAGQDDAVAFRAIDRLRPHLSTLMGRTGFQALLARALVLASPEVPWLIWVRAAADGELDGLEGARISAGADEFCEGEVVLLAQLLGLLVAFIGPALTMRLIEQMWPQLKFAGADFDADSGGAAT